MTTTIQETDERFIAVLSGELDTAAAEQTSQALQPLLDSKGKEIVLDCTDLEYISSSGLRVLLSILKQAKSVGSRVVLKNVNEVIRDVLDISGNHSPVPGNSIASQPSSKSWKVFSKSPVYHGSATSRPTPV